MSKFTVCIASYNQMNYINTALKSVLEQDYKNIEIIIADDCSKDFDEKKIEKFIKENNKDNKEYKILKNKKKLGIVKNFLNALNNATGEYILFFVANDKLQNNHVITNFVNEFGDKKKNIITSQSFEYDMDLKKNTRVIVDRKKALKLNTLSSYDQYIEMCKCCFYDVEATAYRKEFILKKGFDKDYKHVEDWLNWLRFLRGGEKIYYSDFPTLCHNNSKISHSKTKSKNVNQKEYYIDMINIYQKDILKNFGYLKFKDKIKILYYILRRFVIKTKNKTKNYEDLRKLHSFIVCAYKEEHHLEDCIISLINQTIKSEVIISTSTPNDYIKSIASKYNVKMIINEGKKGHREDFCFAFNKAETKYVTLCHQDDIYYKDFGINVVKNMKKYDNSIIGFTNYNENRNGKTVKNNKLLFIKRLINNLLIPFKENKKVRLFTLSIGNAICAPSVTYNTKLLDTPIIETDFKSNIDWITYIDFAKKSGKFIYIKKPLMEHRIHENSTTTSVIADNTKNKEDYQIFKMFWSDRIANFLIKIYSKSEKSNDLKKKGIRK